jgi:hypothetical protein|tara:strand:+ start:179 stop:352 length:174 start_codon:yes stop_codon:yes gene_type:complete
LLYTNKKVIIRINTEILFKFLVINGNPNEREDATYVAYNVNNKIDVARKTSGKKSLK